MSVKIEGVEGLLSDLKELQNLDTVKLNTDQATKFNSKLITWLRENKLNLQPIQPRTIKQRIANIGGPLYDTGDTARTATIKQKADAVEAGFFAGEQTVHGKIDAAYLMEIHHEGKGHNPERPAIDNAKDKFEAEEDDKIIDDFIDGLFE